MRDHGAGREPRCGPQPGAAQPDSWSPSQVNADQGAARPVRVPAQKRRDRRRAVAAASAVREPRRLSKSPRAAATPQSGDEGGLVAAGDVLEGNDSRQVGKLT